MVIQFGLSLIIPLLACLYGCYLLEERTGVGSWIYLVGIAFGLGAGFMTWYKLYLKMDGGRDKRTKDKKEGDDSPARKSFNSHI